MKSAYRNSPYYDYYFYKIERFFEQKETFLVDLNAKILDALFSMLKIDADWSFTTDYVSAPTVFCDMRDSISPKPSRNKPDDAFVPKPYIQVFADRFDFVPNLSILDLIFNVGPESKEYLECCVELNL